MELLNGTVSGAGLAVVPTVVGQCLARESLEAFVGLFGRGVLAVRRPAAAGFVPGVPGLFPARPLAPPGGLRRGAAVSSAVGPPLLAGRWLGTRRV